MKKILVLGAKGQLGKEVVRLFSLEDKSKYECLAPAESDADITNLEKLLKIAKDFMPDVIVNCAAYTDVDGCEEEKEKAKTEKKDEKSDKKDKYPKSSKILPKTSMRKRARTNFLMKSQKEMYIKL